MNDKSTISAEVRDFIVHNIEGHSKDIGRLTAEKFGLSRVTIAKYLSTLIKEGALEASGKTKGREYKLRNMVDDGFRFSVQGLQEDVVWIQTVKPLLSEVQPNVLAICAHGFTEILNNVISHSESQKAFVCIQRNAARILMLVADSGVGIFHKIQHELKLADPQHAILELAKGKLTTEPANHTGEGIFFTSRMFDTFHIVSGGLVFTRFNKQNDWLSEVEGKPGVFENGTTVKMEIKTNAPQTDRQVFDEYRAEFDNFGFSKTIIPLVLMKYEGEQLISRSQAKRLLSRVDQFKEVFLDFKGITTIGQAFADEIFRVYVREHPHVSIHPVNASEDVISMIKRIMESAESSDS
ncbi:MAG: STAS-like domain-containing protein [Nitrospiraceae bacterium]